LSELLLAEQSNDPGKQLPFIGIVQVVGILVAVSVVLNRKVYILYVSDSSDFACRLVEKHLAAVADHPLPKQLVKSGP